MEKKLGVKDQGNLTIEELIETLKTQLKIAQDELQSKIHQSQPVQNMKKMLEKKNEEIKALKEKLSKYEK